MAGRDVLTDYDGNQILTRWPDRDARVAEHKDALTDNNCATNNKVCSRSGWLLMDELKIVANLCRRNIYVLSAESERSCENPNKKSNVAFVKCPHNHPTRANKCDKTCWPRPAPFQRIGSPLNVRKYTPDLKQAPIEIPLSAVQLDASDIFLTFNGCHFGGLITQAELDELRMLSPDQPFKNVLMMKKRVRGEVVDLTID